MRSRPFLRAHLTGKANRMKAFAIHLRRMQDRYSLEPTHTEPRVLIQVPGSGRINLLLRMPVPAKRRGRVEQAVLRRYLELRETDNNPKP